MKTARRGTDERIKRQLAENHARTMENALLEIQSILGDKESLGASECDCIRGIIITLLGI